MTRSERRSSKHPLQAARGGIDLTLIRWMVRLTPTQRLAALQDHIKLVTERRRGATAD